MRRTGMVIVTNCAALKIEWVLQNLPEVKKGVDEGRIIYGTIDTWMIWKMSGGAAHVSDYTNTGCTLLLNQFTMDYDEKILKECSIPRSILPELRSSCEVYALHRPQGVLPGREGARFPGIAGDQNAATFGQACVYPGMAKNTYGTGSFMIMNTGEKFTETDGTVISINLCGPQGHELFWH